MRVALVLVVFLAALVAGAQAGAAPTCGDAAARSAVRYAKPRIATVGEPQTFPPKAADRPLCFDATGDGLTDMAVGLFSGGTAGEVAWVFFAAKPDGWRLAGWGGGYKLLLRQAGKRLEVVQPVYRSNDPNCCPTGGFDHTPYGWNGAKLVLQRSVHTKSPR